MANVTQCKRDAMLAIVGAPENIDDLENLYLQANGATPDIHVNDQWMEVYKANGATSDNWNVAAKEFLFALGASSANLPDNWQYFWCTLGGVVGPAVVIQRNNDPGFCEYQPPDTVFCAASETYTAIDYGFSGSPLSYSWSVTGGTAIITGSSLSQTVTVETQNSASNQTFQLTCTVSNADPESVEKIVFFTQPHTDTNVIPEYIGPNINSRDYAVNVPITPVETFNLFLGTNLVFTLEGTWPTGLVIDADTGQITGTPTGALQPYPDLTIKVTNSKGDASSTAFSITLTSTAVAPLFDNGPIPDQNWPIDQAIAQFPIGQFFTTGSFPRTYTIESGALPSGLTMNTAGQINGTPTVDAEVGSVVIRCTNSEGFALTNEWNWLTWEAISQISTIPTQTAEIGALFTHDYSQYFTGTVSGYVINAASWPPDTVFDTATGIATFTPTVDFSHTGAVVVAESDYTPSFIVSNNFSWEVVENLPVFWACSDDDGVFVNDVIIGVGGLTEANVSTRYYPDEIGIWQEFGSGVAGKVYADGKWWLVGQKQCVNELLWSSDLTNAAWTVYGTDVAALNQVGMRGEANGATTLTDDDVAAYEYVRWEYITIPADTNTHVIRYFVKKDSDETRFPLMSIYMVVGGTTTVQDIHLNTKTGAITSAGAQGAGGSFESNSAGDWWEVLISAANVNNTRLYTRVGGANGTVFGTPSVAATGSTIVGNVELHLNATIQSVRKSSAIFTSGATVVVDASALLEDSANQNDTEGAWFVNVVSEDAQNIIDGFLTITGTDFVATDGTNSATQPWTAGTEHKVGIAYGDGNMNINVDGTWGTETSYDGTLLQGVLDLFRTPQATGRLRDQRRYDATYAEAIVIIDGEML